MRIFMKTLSKNLMATAIATLFIAPAAFATNGTNMTGISAPAVALGGTGAAAYFGPSNTHTNPALLGKSEGTIFGFGGTVFKPNVSNNGLGGSLAGAPQTDSDANMFLIPSVAVSSRINNNWVFGIGMYGTSGMGVDYSESSSTGLFKAQSSLQIMRITPSISYNSSNYGIGFSPIIQYGALDINYVMDTDNNPMNGFTNPVTQGSGMKSDLGYGFTLGGYYDLTKQFTLGATYTSAISMKYKGQLSGASGPFAAMNLGGGLTALSSPFADTLEQPAEIKVGAAYTFGRYMLTGDLKQIRWGDAKGYKDFGWEDQNVIALGLKYSGNGYWLGAGYNKADNPIKAKSVSMGTQAGADASTVNMFNNIFFPATTEQHFSVGGGYDITKNVSVDGAMMFAPEVTTTVNTSMLTPAQSTNTTKHSQTSYTFSVKYKF